MTLPAQQALVAYLKANTSALVALDPQEDYIVDNEVALRQLIGQTDVFLPSAEEARRLLSHEDWAAAARTFAGWGPSLVVVKLGQEGCLVYDRDRDAVLIVPAVPTTAVDTTGAGDCFCGVFMAALSCAGADPLEAARAGAVAASFAVEGYGVEPMFTATPEDARAPGKRCPLTA